MKRSRSDFETHLKKSLMQKSRPGESGSKSRPTRPCTSEEDRLGGTIERYGGPLLRYAVTKKEKPPGGTN